MKVFKTTIKQPYIHAMLKINIIITNNSVKNEHKFKIKAYSCLEYRYVCVQKNPKIIKSKLSQF